MMAFEVAKKRQVVQVFYGLLMVCLSFRQANAAPSNGPSGGECRAIVEGSVVNTRAPRPTKFIIPKEAMRHITEGDFKWERGQQPYLDVSGKPHMGMFEAPTLKSGMHTTRGFNKFLEMRQKSRAPLNLNTGFGHDSGLPSSKYFSTSMVRAVRFPTALQVAAENGVLIFGLPRQAISFELASNSSASTVHSQLFGSLGFVLNGYTLKFGFPESFTEVQIAESIFKVLNDSNSAWRKTANGSWRVDGVTDGPMGPMLMMVAVDSAGRVKTASPLVDFKEEDRKISQRRLRDLLEQTLIIIKTVDFANQMTNGYIATDKGVESDWSRAMKALLEGAQGTLAMIASRAEEVSESKMRSELILAKSYKVNNLTKILKTFKGLESGERIKWPEMRSLLKEFERAIGGNLPMHRPQYLIDFTEIHSARIDSAVGYRYNGEKIDDE